MQGNVADLQLVGTAYNLLICENSLAWQLLTGKQVQTASKSVQFLAVVAIVSACIVNTDAVAFRDVDSFVVNGKGQMVNSGAAANGVFSIVSPSEGNSITIGAGYGSESGKTYSDVAGFRPGYDIAYNASAFFYIRDDKDYASEMVNVKLGWTAFR